MSDTADRPNPADLPETFTIADLEAVFEPHEIAQMQKDDPDLLVAPPVVAEDVTPDPAAEAAAALEAAKAAPVVDEAKPVLADIPDTTAAEQRIAETKAARTKAREKYDEGEMTAAEYDAELDKIMSNHAAAAAEIRAAEEIIESNTKVANDTWLESLDKFKAQGNEALFEGDHRSGFDKALKTVTGDPDNAALPFSVMISMAARQHAMAYEARTGKPVPIKTAAGGVAPGTGQPKRLGPNPDPRPDPIETLSGINAPGEEAVTESRFTAIDKTADRDPLKAEEMMLTMTPDQMDRYLEVGY